MTEQEWRACRDPRSLLVEIEPMSSLRKARLFACSLARSYLPFMGDDRSRDAVAVAERHGDSSASESELAACRSSALSVVGGSAARLAAWAADRSPWQAARMTVITAKEFESQLARHEHERRLLNRCRPIFHCIFGNPLRPVAFDPAWRTSTVLALAEGIYADRAFDRLPILADALEDAGCAHPDILQHCRGEGPHVRGCWVVDLILGKS